MGREIVVQNPHGYLEGRGEALGSWVESLVEELAPTAVSFTVRLTGEAEIRDLNRHYRGKDRPTDVLSFPGEATPEGLHLGDVVVSVPTARRRAPAAGGDPSRELRTLILHGVLHCLGYDHEADDGAMRRLEAELRERWIGADD